MVETAQNIWRDKTNPADPSSADWKPVKSEIRSWGTWIENSTAGGLISTILWSTLSTITPTQNRNAGEVVGPDAGTHTDPVTSTVVNNVGRYSYVTGTGWQRVGDLTYTILQNNITTVSNNLSTETTNRTNADLALQANIDAEEDARIAADEAIVDSFDTILEDQLGLPVFDEKAADVLAAAKDGSAILYVDFDGNLVDNSYAVMFDEYLLFAVVAKDNTLLYGIGFDGRIYPASINQTENKIYTYDGKVVGLIDSTKRIKITNEDLPAGSEYGSMYGDEKNLYYIVDDGTTATINRVYIYPSSTLVSSTMNHVVFYGQSLSRPGVSGTAYSGFRTPISPGVVLMFGGPTGFYTNGNGDEVDLPTPIEWLDNIVDGYDVGYSTNSPCAGAAAAAVNTSIYGTTSKGMLITNAARGGMPFVNLQKGSTFLDGLPWKNLALGWYRAKIIAQLLNKTYVPYGFAMIYGEADRINTAQTYYSYGAILKEDVKNDMGDGTIVPITMCQTSNWTKYNIEFSGPPLAQLQLALNDPDFICPGPKYMYDYAVDGLHLQSHSSANIGYKHMLFLNRKKQGLDYKPAYVTSASISGAVITLNVHVLTAPLVIDTSLVSDPGNYGIVWNQVGGTARSIQSVSVSGTTITVTLDGDPGMFTDGVTDENGFVMSGTFIGIADRGVSGNAGGRTTGPRTCIRDSFVAVDPLGQDCHNYLCHQQVAIKSLSVTSVGTVVSGTAIPGSSVSGTI